MGQSNNQSTTTRIENRYSSNRMSADSKTLPFKTKIKTNEIPTCFLKRRLSSCKYCPLSDIFNSKVFNRLPNRTKTDSFCPGTPLMMAGTGTAEVSVTLPAAAGTLPLPLPSGFSAAAPFSTRVSFFSVNGTAFRERLNGCSFPFTTSGDSWSAVAFFTPLFPFSTAGFVTCSTVNTFSDKVEWGTIFIVSSGWMLASTSSSGCGSHGSGWPIVSRCFDALPVPGQKERDAFEAWKRHQTYWQVTVATSQPSMSSKQRPSSGELGAMLAVVVLPSWGSEMLERRDWSK